MIELVMITFIVAKINMIMITLIMILTLRLKILFFTVITFDQIMKIISLLIR